MYLARTISLRDFYLFYNWWLGRQSKLTGKQSETEKNRNEHRTKIHTEMIKSISLISLGQHLLHCKYIPTSCSQNFFTKKLQLFMSWSIFLFVFSLKINETIHSIRIKQWVQQKQNITHRYGSTHIFRRRFYDTHYHVSITHRYGSTYYYPFKENEIDVMFQSLIGTVQLTSVLETLMRNLASFNLS